MAPFFLAVFSCASASIAILAKWDDATCARRPSAASRAFLPPVHQPAARSRCRDGRGQFRPNEPTPPGRIQAPTKPRAVKAPFSRPYRPAAPLHSRCRFHCSSLLTHCFRAFGFSHANPMIYVGILRVSALQIDCCFGETNFAIPRRPPVDCTCRRRAASPRAYFPTRGRPARGSCDERMIGAENSK